MKAASLCSVARRWSMLRTRTLCQRWQSTFCQTIQKRRRSARCSPHWGKRGREKRKFLRSSDMVFHRAKSCHIEKSSTQQSPRKGKGNTWPKKRLRKLLLYKSKNLASKIVKPACSSSCKPSDYHCARANKKWGRWKEANQPKFWDRKGSYKPEDHHSKNSKWTWVWFRRNWLNQQKGHPYIKCTKGITFWQNTQRTRDQNQSGEVNVVSWHKWNKSTLTSQKKKRLTVVETGSAQPICRLIARPNLLVACAKA